MNNSTRARFVGRVGIALSMLAFSPLFAAEVAKLTAADSSDNNQFGIAVAVVGNTAVVGSWRDDSVNLASGSAYIFQRPNSGSDQWAQLTKLTGSGANAGQNFGLALDLDGDTLAVGAAGDDQHGNSAGAIYLFSRNDGGPANWGEVAKLFATAPASADRFGAAVAIAGNYMVVGAPGNQTGGTDSGAAYVFQRDISAQTWTQVRKLIAPVPSVGSQFGIAVAIDGTTAVVGEWRNFNATTRPRGAAYIFERDQGGANMWGRSKTLTAADVSNGANFGAAVAIDEETIVVGAPAIDSPATGLESTYVYERNRGGLNNWGQAKKLVLTPVQPRRAFGRGVAIEGSTIVVGSPTESQAGLEAGTAYVFQRDLGGTGNWGQFEQLNATDTSAGFHAGQSVSLDADTILLGAPGDRLAGGDTGSAYVYRLVTEGPSLSIHPQGGSITLSWATVAQEYLLQTTPTLNPVAWQPAPGGSMNPVVLPAGGSMSFYRLLRIVPPPFAFVPVGSPGNNPDSTTGFGSVVSSYQIGKYEVTNDEYARFLNAVAPTDTFNLFNPAMSSDPRGGITRSGVSGGFSYAARNNMGSKPVNFVGVYDALRFANWVHNGEKSGPQNATTTENGAYTFSGVSTVGARNAGAKVWLPDENEWYKAAYYDATKSGSPYWLYPTRSATLPVVATATASGQVSNPGVNVANYLSGAVWNGQEGNVTTVGSAGTGSESFFRAADMGGNVTEWTETILEGSRIIRGGSWGDFESSLEAGTRAGQDPTTENDTTGFRIARP